jgi:hypothetical protein
MLNDLGYTQGNVTQASTRVVLTIRRQRKTTVENLRVMSMEEAAEIQSRHIKGLLSVSKMKGLIKKEYQGRVCAKTA